MFFFVYYLNKYITTTDKTQLVLSFFFMIALVFTRVEAPLIIAFILGYVAHKGMKTEILVRYIAYLLFVLLFWYVGFFLHVGLNYESAFLTIDKCAVIVGLLGVVAIYAKLKEKYFEKYNVQLLKTYFVALIVFTVALNLLDSEKFLININAVYMNMFVEGRWTVAWFAVCFFGAIATLITRKKAGFMGGIIYIYLVVLFAIFALRDNNLHIFWGDSGNRILMHIYPILIYVIADNIVSYFKPNRLKVDEIDKKED